MCVSKYKRAASPNRPTLNVNEIWDLVADNPHYIAKTNVTRHPRRLWMMVNAWLIKLGQLLIGN